MSRRVQKRKHTVFDECIKRREGGESQLLDALRRLHGEAKEYRRGKLIESLKKNMSGHRGSPPPPLLKAPNWESQFVSFPADKMPQLVYRMRCSSCGKVTPQSKRYVCPEGHHFCEVCGVRKVANNGAMCMAEVKPEKPSGDNDDDNEGITVGAEGAAGPDPELGPSHSTSTHTPVNCQELIRPYISDPVYNAVCNLTTWECPLHTESECDKKTLLGTELRTHIEQSNRAENQNDGGVSSEEEPKPEVKEEAIIVHGF